MSAPRRLHGVHSSQFLNNQIEARGLQRGNEYGGAGARDAALDISGQPISSVGQRHAELAARVRNNDGAETGPAGDEDRRAGQWMANHGAESPLDGAAGQLRQQRSRNKSHSRQQKHEPVCPETMATGGAR